MMDPNETLKQIRIRVADTLADRDVSVIKLAEHCEALDEWLSKGGFSPTDWDHPYGDKAREEDRMRREEKNPWGTGFKGMTF